MPGEDRRKITPDKSGKHKVEKTNKDEKLVPPTDKSKKK